MFQAGTAFIGGVMAANRIADLPFPQFSRAVDEGETFRLHVRVVAASIPSLADPGLLRRERPRLEVVLGDVRKLTEFGEFKRDTPESTEGGASSSSAAPAARWRFGDTLTFLASGANVLGPGVQLWLRSNSDVNLGMFQVNLSQMRDIGTCSVDLRRDVLPACVLQNQGAAPGSAGALAAMDPLGSHAIWETPAMVLPLAHVGVDSSPYVLAEAAAHVTVTFGVNVDPQAILRGANERMRPLAERVATPLRQWIQEPVRWVYEASTAATCDACEADAPRAGRAACPSAAELPRALPRVAEVCEAVSSATVDGCSPLCEHETAAPPRVMQLPGHIVTPRTASIDAASNIFKGPGVMSPDLQSDGWVSHIGPNGRQFWHHLSLGPPPWEQQTMVASAVAPSLGHASPTSRQAPPPSVRTPGGGSSAVAPSAVPFPAPLTLPLPTAAVMPASTPAGAAAAGSPVAAPYTQMQAEADLAREAVAVASPCGTPLSRLANAAHASMVARPEGDEAAAKVLGRSLPNLAVVYANQVAGSHMLQAARQGIPARQSFQGVEAAQAQRGLPARASFQAVDAAHAQRALPARSSFQAVEAHHGQLGLPARTSFAGVNDPMWMVSTAPLGTHSHHRGYAVAPTVLVGTHR